MSWAKFKFYEGCRDPKLMKMRIALLQPQSCERIEIIARIVGSLRSR